MAVTHRCVSREALNNGTTSNEHNITIKATILESRQRNTQDSSEAQP